MRIEWKLVNVDGYPEKEGKYLWLSSGFPFKETGVEFMSLSTAKNNNHAMKMGIIDDGWTYFGWGDISNLSKDEQNSLITKGITKTGCEFYRVNKELIENIPELRDNI
jgi:hypothetical protein